MKIVELFKTLLWELYKTDETDYTYFMSLNVKLFYRMLCFFCDK